MLVEVEMLRNLNSIIKEDIQRKLGNEISLHEN